MSGLRGALALFTVAPVAGPVELTRPAAVAALRWFPAVGVVLGAAAGLPATAVLQWAPHAALLGAVLAVLVLVLLSRGLHLDGLADTVDGLGSGAPAERALEIMRRADVGPFGATAVVLVLLVDVAALWSVTGGVWRPVAALAVAAATGRLTAVWAAHRSVPSARASGFGAYVAGSASTQLLVMETAATLSLAVAMAAAADADPLGWALAVAGALIAGRLLIGHATRRLGGVTGDVFGALVEIGTALTLVGLALG